MSNVLEYLVVHSRNLTDGPNGGILVKELPAGLVVKLSKKAFNEVCKKEHSSNPTLEVISYLEEYFRIETEKILKTTKNYKSNDLLSLYGNALELLERLKNSNL
ncbi:MAG: hypothetical protein RQ930_02070 [Candidatus Aenigmarchaeota archaeon]|nr:hypothetical protein [Candidatus Aenigmarchaeota archaeon]